MAIGSEPIWPRRGVNRFPHAEGSAWVDEFTSTVGASSPPEPCRPEIPVDRPTLTVREPQRRLFCSISTRPMAHAQCAGCVAAMHVAQLALSARDRRQAFGKLLPGTGRQAGRDGAVACDGKRSRSARKRFAGAGARTGAFSSHWKFIA